MLKITIDGISMPDSPFEKPTINMLTASAISIARAASIKRFGDHGFDSGVVTTKVLSKKGDYTILVPKSKVAVIIEVLVDRNEDGLPTPGERMAVLDRGGQIVPYKDLKDLNLDVTNRKIEGPMGGPLSPDEPPPPGQD